MKFKFSAVILTFNTQNTLKECLESVVGQTRKFDEIIIVDGGSRDKTLEIAKEILSSSKIVFKIIFDDGLGLAGARNIGWKNSDTNYVAYIDSDVVLEKEWLYKIEATIKEKKAVVISGSNELLSERFFHKLLWVFFSKKGVKKSSEVNGTINTAFKKDWLEKVGGFDPAFKRGGEDADVLHRLKTRGALLYLNEDAHAYHIIREDFRAFIKKMYIYGKSNFSLAKKNKRFFLKFFLTLHALFLVFSIPIYLFEKNFFTLAFLIVLLTISFFYSGRLLLTIDRSKYSILESILGLFLHYLQMIVQSIGLIVMFLFFIKNKVTRGF